jgi:type VI secretion system FHA domain protein
VRPDREPASLSALTSAAVPVEDPLALLGGAATPSPLGQSVISDSPREDSKWWQEPVAANSLARQPTLDEAFEAPRFTPATPNSTRQSAAVAPSRLNEKLGIDKVAPELLENKVISALTTVVDKLIGILRARSSIKNDMRVDRTIIGVSENNPLKFSPTAQDALKLMFGPESPAFMNADRAFAEGILDLEEHQLATLQGIRFAYDQMLRQFSPEAIQALAEASGKGGSSVLGGNKKKLWEVYEQHYQQLTSDPEASYNRLFGEALAQAYEAGLKELKLRRR